jgi:hypothetical protein
LRSARDRNALLLTVGNGSAAPGGPGAASSRRNLEK